MRFLVDEQLPTALARWIMTQGHHAEHVLEIGLGGAGDAEIWHYAARNNAIVITKDIDFMALSKVNSSAGLVRLRSGNLPRKALLAQMEGVFQDICTALKSGERIVEVGG